MMATLNETLWSRPKMPPKTNKKMSGNRKVKNSAVRSRKTRFRLIVKNTLMVNNLRLKLITMPPFVGESQAGECDLVVFLRRHIGNMATKKTDKLRRQLGMQQERGGVMRFGSSS